jgi:hypothetical protein
MKKLIVFLIILFSFVISYAKVDMTVTKGNATITTDASKIYDYLNRGWTIQNEATLIQNITKNNANTSTNPSTGTITPVTTTSITFSATGLTVGYTSVTAVSVKAGLSKARIGGIVQTAHDTPLFGIIRSVKGDSITVGAWYNLTTTTAITPSPTTGKAIYFYDFEEITQTKTASGKILKFARYTTTTAITTGAGTTISHGLTGANIVGLQAVAKVTTNAGFTPNSTTASNIYLYDAYFDATNIIIVNSTSGTAITGKAISVLLTYEE